ncbi:MAG: signal peptide peptidase SppA [Phycisphaeraceae bacterium]|nr:MAG: signal peptide peptidase SppA [Phycisphaeraceae bacterium]
METVGHAGPSPYTGVMHKTRPIARFVRFTACLALAACSLASLTGCLPNRVVIDLAPGDGSLAETQVLIDPGAGRSAPKIAQIDLQGLISHAPSPGLLSGRSNAVDSIVTRLRKAEDDPMVRAVILRINSPGGTVAASETIYSEIRGFRERSGKPVIVSMGEVAASGGYYIALAADHIIAQPTSITGSIGVIVQTFNFSRGMDRIGISGRAVVSRENKAIANPFETPVEEHYRILQHLTDQFYEQFRTLVADRRPQIRNGSASLDTITDGRVFTGAEGVQLGVVDETGSLRDAFERAKALVNLDRARLVKYHAQGVTVGSPYATTLDHHPTVMRNASGGGITLAPVRVDLPGGTGLPGFGGEPSESGFYYLWIAPTP